MAEVINMPRLSDTMEEGTVATWLKKVGDTVKEGDILAEIETDKATMEFESFHEGTLLHIGINEGETAPVDTLLAIIGKKDEDISDLIEGKSSEKKSKEDDSKDDNTKTKKKDDDDDTSEKASEEKDSEEESENSSDEKKQSSSSSKSSGKSELPEGVQVITMPRLSDTMTEGTVASWLKKEGDKVEEGDILAEIETDKATMEFESFYSGTLLKIGLGEGESASVDALLAIIGPKGTDVSGVAENFKDGSSSAKGSEDEEKEDIKEPSKDVSKEKETKKETVSENKTEATHTTNEGRIFVSPLAKKLAEEKGINLRQVRGSGENGRIVKSDIENYQPAAGGEQAYVPVGTESFEEVKNSQMRKTIAKRLGESKFSAPEYYLTVELDMDQAIAAREAINADPDVKISFNDMVIKACAMALRKHPRVNSQWTQEATKIAKHIHIGVAVAVDEGLLVPVLKFADQMTFSQIGGQVKELAGKARNKKITPQEMEGSTFTVSNLGMFGITEFTSIINQPNSAILSVGAIVQKPVVKNGQIAIGNTMMVTLACDHRTVDGATGAKFLQTLRQYIENPVTMFV
ncbi:pyruvate dehydrogenase complex dihydrolipoamide acetyltransferase [Aequorivita lipolytica]|uniref:Acetyltransferase component of pyruvate dehydrogenase complex n=1 Tax=Aequorivita lipolytica TaxID=153267 RepID=A0A5C6YRF2_9FLAO|nr:pyruvate dehydrogenase complex dihydrolipoamide acetyltransferase [Aequorivita lipolytica]TXD69949.1 pyruvate dehydrogenase complex dihydrolipoamide acetyltransferase [Aequorivita lipolytica]SRX50227.1 Dihydrolipoyllysine-residue acetyltransferase component of pyruvate dehydrogenase complex [Aequorivita lipolytica]